MSTKSFVTTPIVLAAAIHELRAAAHLGENVRFITNSGAPLTPHQKIMTDLALASLPTATILMQRHIISCIVSSDFEEVNRWFEANDMTTRLEKSGAANPVYIGAAYRQPLYWVPPGDERQIIDVNGQKFAGVKMSADAVHYYRVGETDQIVVSLPDANYAYMLYFAMPPEEPQSEADMLEVIMNWQPRLGLIDDFDKFYYPMIDIAAPSSVEWLTELILTDDKGRAAPIGGVAIASSLKINEYGALGRSGLGLEASAVPAQIEYKPAFIIDRPCIAWITLIPRDGNPAQQPLMAAWLKQDVWKNPGILRF